ncbi:hypothetical protein BDW75DRAFT_217209 [Aspergillus navahoensis]
MDRRTTELPRMLCKLMRCMLLYLMFWVVSVSELFPSLTALKSGDLCCSDNS